MTLIDKAEALRRIVLTGEQMAGTSSSDVVDAIHRDVAATPARGVGVKPLVWTRADEDDGVPQWVSGIYFIRYTAAGYKLRINGIEMPKRYLGNDGDDQAKADANKDHEARILAALEQEGRDG